MRRRWMAIGLALATAAVLVPTTGAHVSAGGGSSATGIGTVTWGPCNDATLDYYRAECGMLSVPLDSARPRGEKIQLALSRVRHRVPDAQYQGIMLVNPGGPGGSGLVYSAFSWFVPNDAGGAYDWIGFDPRGVGKSVPALSCDPDYTAGPRPQYDPDSFRIEAAWLRKSATYALDCGRAGGNLLGHLKTTDNVADMDAIRQALGERQINFYGFSYGTYLGQVYATLHPQQVRRMVLDGNVDPRQIWYKANIDQDHAFETVIQVFFDWVARHDDVYGLGTTAAEVQATYYTSLDSLAAAPQGQLGASEWVDAFTAAGYGQWAWEDTAAALAAFVHDGDAGPATDLYLGQDGPGDDNGYAMYLATECTDAPWSRNWLFWRQDNARVARDAPFFTWSNAWFNAPCVFWPAAQSQPVNIDGRKTPPILLLSETLDAATPYTGSLEVRRRFPGASLIATVGGTTHANSLAGNDCVDEPIADYLADGTLPPRVAGNVADLECAAAPEPEPAPDVAVATPAARSAAPAVIDVRRQLQSSAVH